METQRYKLRLASGLFGLLGFLALLAATVVLAHGAPRLAALSGTGAVIVAVKSFYTLLQGLGK